MYKIEETTDTTRTRKGLRVKSNVKAGKATFSDITCTIAANKSTP